MQTANQTQPVSQTTQTTQTTAKAKGKTMQTAKQTENVKLGKGQSLPKANANANPSSTVNTKVAMLNPQQLQALKNAQTLISQFNSSTNQLVLTKPSKANISPGKTPLVKGATILLQVLNMVNTHATLTTTQSLAIQQQLLATVALLENVAQATPRVAVQPLPATQPTAQPTAQS